MMLVHRQPGADVYLGDSIGQLPEPCDLLCVDAPYSERTHAAYSNLDLRAQIPYAHWTHDDIARAVEAWAPCVRGWFVTITDDVLAPLWASELNAAGRYTFAPVPWVAPGGRVRLRGDGPSSWTCWIVVARPRTNEFSRWGTLPGAYIYAQDRDAIPGGKPMALMRAIVSDYSRPGDTVCDPCCGGGTTLRAAVDLGRRAIGIDIARSHVDATIARLRQTVLLT